MHEPIGPFRVLCVGDAFDSGRTILEIGARAGGTTCAAVVPGLAAALGALDDGVFDLVVCQHSLADGTALDLVAARIAVPVVVLVPEGDDLAGVLAIAAGAVDVVAWSQTAARIELPRLTVERARRERRASRRSHMLQQALASINDSIFITDLDGRLVYVNAMFSRAYGYREEEVLGRRAEMLWDASGTHELGPQPALPLDPAGERGECTHVRRSGEAFAVLLSRSAITGEHGTPVAIVGACRDMTERDRAAKKLSLAALHDPLTQLPNRALFIDRLTHAVQRGRRDNSGFGVIFIDLDRFKTINDDFGHAAGDQVLRAVGRRLASSLREGDTVARLGGDEILRDADTAMYRAKTHLGTHHVMFEPSMRRRPADAPNLEQELITAIDDGQLLLHYQPIFDLRHGRLCGFEALVRWNHPRRGLLLPTEFLPAASDVGLSMAIGTWVLRRALTQAAAWRRVSGQRLTMTVNLDDAMLRSEQLMAVVGEALRASRMPGSCLLLDVSEGVVLLDAERTAAAFEDLHRSAVGFAIDDFGTSASSIDQLHRLPIDTLKIDRSLIGRIGVDEQELRVVRTIVALARQLDLRVTAEGVETVEQLALLRTLGCDSGQGHLFGRAVDPAEAGRLIDRGAPELPRFVVQAS